MLFQEMFFRLKLNFIISILYILGFRFIVCYDKLGKEASFRMRYDIYGREGYIDPNDYLNNSMCDEYDEHSIHLVGVYKDQLIATARIIQNSNKGFPVEKLFNVKYSYSSDNVAEISRLGIQPEFRSKFGQYSRAVMLGMAIRMYKESRKAGIKFWLAGMPEKLAGSFKLFGADFEKLREYTLTRENREARKHVDGYFKKVSIHPYIADVSKVSKNGLSLQKLLRRKKKSPVSISGDETFVKQ